MLFDLGWGGGGVRWAAIEGVSWLALKAGCKPVSLYQKTTMDRSLLLLVITVKSVSTNSSRGFAVLLQLAVGTNQPDDEYSSLQNYKQHSKS